MNNMIYEQNGLKVEILDITYNKIYECGNCYCRNNCSYKKSIFCTYGSFLKCTAICFELSNLTERNFEVWANHFKIIDKEGNTFTGSDLCKDFIEPYTQSTSCSVIPRSKSKFTVIFPVIEKDSIAAIDYGLSCFDKFHFDFADVNLGYSYNDEYDHVPTEQDTGFNNCLIMLSIYKESIFERLNNLLTPREIINLENKIMNNEKRISKYLETAKPWEINLLKNDFETTKKMYEPYAKEFLDYSAKVKKNAVTVDELIELSPRDFEIWTADLFKTLGYTDVDLTPQVNDKGVDVFLQKDGKKIAVQCKKFKGTVDAPTIQQFIGAISTSHSDAGIFITTGTFTVGAEKMALDYPIELYDRFSICDLIEKALSH